MRLKDAVKLVEKDVMPKLSTKEQIAVAAIVDFTKKVLAARNSFAVLYKALFEHVNQVEMFGSADPADGESDG